MRGVMGRDLASSMTFRALTHKLVTALLVALPLVITLYIFYWLLALTEAAMRGIMMIVMPDAWYVPGMGLVLGLLLLFSFGLLLQAWTVRRLWMVFESKIEQVPVIKSIYGAVRDLMNFFSTSGNTDFDQVVLVKSEQVTDAKLLGFVTRTEFDDVPPQLGANDCIAVYLPMSYQLGGFTVFVPRRNVEAVDMSLEDAMRFVLTAGVKSQKSAIALLDEAAAAAVSEATEAPPEPQAAPQAPPHTA